MGLETIHLCTISTLSLWLAGLARNDVSKVGKLCWVFVMVGELTSGTRYCSNVCVGGSGSLCPLVVYGVSNRERRTLLQN